MMIEDVIIIGAGPAGVAAAIQLQRHGLAPLILEGSRVGGLLINANLVENYPGFPGGITGMELVDLLENHLQKTGARVLLENTDRVEYDGGCFTVKTPERTLRSRAVIIASGTRHKIPGFRIPREAEERVFYDVFPLLEKLGRKIAIIGAGDAAFDYALNLAGKNEIFIIYRSEQVKCLPLLKKRVEENSTIHCLGSTHLKKILPSPHALTLTCAGRTGDFDMTVDYLLCAVGREPRLEFLDRELKKRLKEFQEKGIAYLVGDVKNRHYRQAAIAVGDGIRAAMKLAEQLREDMQ